MRKNSDNEILQELIGKKFPVEVLKQSLEK